jgi:hypothetical protein
MTRHVWLPISALILIAAATIALFLVPALPPWIAGLACLAAAGCMGAHLFLFARQPAASSPAPATEPAPAVPVAAVGAAAPVPPASATPSPQAQVAAEGLVEALALLPFSRAILEAVPGKTEHATMSLIEECAAIRGKTAKQAEAARDSIACIDDDCDDDSLQTTIAKTRQAIESEGRNIAAILANNKSSTDRVRSMSQEIDAGLELLRGIDEITQRSKVIAISLAIEAAHIGEKGKGFQVISGELHALNERSVEYSDKVGKLLARFKDYNGALITAMTDQSTHIVQEIEKSFTASLGAVGTLIEASNRSYKLARDVACQAKEIDADLQRLLESLQFQDISRQMVEGAVDILDELRAGLAKIQPLLETNHQPILAASRERQEQLKPLLAGRAKTMDEKHAITGVKS